jgi:ubiquinone/menaquinone biosynthesis C-methylase UbiE
LLFQARVERGRSDPGQVRIRVMVALMDYHAIYRDHAEDYDRLISAEDCDGNLLPALESLHALQGARVLDVGTGTGRIARLVVSRAAHIVGVEPSAGMRAVAQRHLLKTGLTNWELHEGYADALPVATGSADLAVAAWVLGHQRKWRPDGWKMYIGNAIAEMERVITPGGTIVIIETLGTGYESPTPSAELSEVYAWLEADNGFTRQVLQTDYAFPDVETAARVCGAFFGEKMSQRIVEKKWARVPEHTGLWSRQKPLAAI